MSPSQLNRYPGANLFPGAQTYPNYITLVPPTPGVQPTQKRYYILRMGRTSVRRVIR